MVERGRNPLGLKIARTLTQGSLADSVAGLEDTIPLGLRTHRTLRRSARLIGIGLFARPLVLDAARVNGLAWLCGSAPEANPGGIGRQVCVTTRRLRIRHWIYVPMFLAKLEAKCDLLALKLRWQCECETDDLALLGGCRRRHAVHAGTAQRKARWRIEGEVVLPRRGL